MFMVSSLLMIKFVFNLIKKQFPNFQVFEDALEDLVDTVEEVSINNNNNNNTKTSKLSSKSFKLKRSKWKKTSSSVIDEDEDIPLELGLAEGQEAIDLFFDNRFEDSRELANKQ